MSNVCFVVRSKKAPQGYTLPAFSWFIDQTIGGAIATATHGSSFLHGSLSNQASLDYHTVSHNQAAAFELLALHHARPSLSCGRRTKRKIHVGHAVLHAADSSVHVSVTYLTLTWHHKLLYQHYMKCFCPLCGPAGHLHTSCLGQWYTRPFLAPQQPAPVESNAGVHRQNPMVPCHCSLLHPYAASTLTNLYWCAHLLLTWSLQVTQLAEAHSP